MHNHWPNKEILRTQSGAGVFNQQGLTGSCVFSIIYELIEDGDKVSAKLIFHGIQQEPMFGAPPSRKQIWWYGAPIFTFDGDKVRDLWVLGDIHGLLNRAAAEKNEANFQL
ncbi:ester cyclase [Pseudomonas mohnii]